MKQYILKFNNFINESADHDRSSLKNLTSINRDVDAKRSADRDMRDVMPGSFEDPYEYKTADNGEWPDPEFDEFEDIMDLLLAIDIDYRPVGDESGLTIQNGGIRRGDIRRGEGSRFNWHA